MFRFFKALFAGILGGAIIGMLFAPKKGTELRKDLQKDPMKTLKTTAKCVGDDISQTAKTVSEDEKVKSGLNKAKQIGEKAKDKAKTIYTETVPKDKRKKIEKTVNKGIKKVKDIKNKL